jgi:hypothetical protein
VSSDTSTTLVFAKVIALSDRADLLTFDCHQLFIGESASRAARADGLDPGTMNAPVYLRNRFPHRQVLPVAEGCPVAAPIDGWQVLAGFDRRHSRSGDYYWLVIGADGLVHGALWQPTY